MEVTNHLLTGMILQVGRWIPIPYYPPWIQVSTDPILRKMGLGAPETSHRKEDGGPTDRKWLGWAPHL